MKRWRLRDVNPEIRAGHELAIKMMKEMEEIEFDALTVVRTENEGAQRNLVQEYLEQVRKRNSPEFELGFTAILTDVIGGDMTVGGVTGPEFYETVDYPYLDDSQPTLRLVSGGAA